MQQQTVVRIAIVFTSIAVLALGGWWYFLKSSSEDRYSAEQTPYSVLAAENAAFTEAEQMVKSGDFRGARALYADALDAADDRVQEAQVKYKIAATYELQGDYVTAIRLFKEIADNTQSPSIFRGYAVMRLGAIFNTHGFGEHVDPIIDETFKGHPYASFLEGGDIRLAYRKLYEYSSSFYPVAASELRIADWHANYIFDQRFDMSAEELAPNVDIVLEKLASAEVETRRIEQDPNEAGLLAEILTRRGEVLAKLSFVAAQVGEAHAARTRAKGVSYEAAEDAYRRALESQIALGNERGQDGIVRFLYASFLERFVAGRQDDMRALLAPLYEDDVYENASVTPFLRAQRNSDSWMNRSLVRMAAIDPKFKQHLVSLGWTAADF